MVGLNERIRTVDLPFSLRLFGVSEAKFDELADEDTKAELLDGVMIVHSPASPRHDRLAGFLRSLGQCYTQEIDWGEVFGPDALIHLATCRLFAPDAFFLKKKRVPHPLPRDQFEGAPDLVIEVLSPSNRDDDLEDKRPAYRQAGVKEIWFIDPDKEEVIIDRRRRKTYTTRTIRDGRITFTVIPGFWVEVEWLWADPLPKVLTCLRKLLQ